MFVFLTAFCVFVFAPAVKLVVVRVCRSGAIVLSASFRVCAVVVVCCCFLCFFSRVFYSFFMLLFLVLMLLFLLSVFLVKWLLFLWTTWHPSNNECRSTRVFVVDVDVDGVRGVVVATVSVFVVGIVCCCC